MKKITIIGLIDNLGGREIEVRNIICSLSNNFELKVISLYYMTNESVAVKDLNCNHTNIYKEIFKSNIYFKTLSFLSKILHNSNSPAYFFIDNNFSKKILNIQKEKIKILRSEILKSDAILYCGVLDLHLLNDMISFSEKHKKPLILRTTGEIKNINLELHRILPKIHKVLVHSSNNADILNGIIPDKIEIIDQTTLIQKDLLELTIKPNKANLVFGYLGRLSQEKGIVPLLEIFNKIDFPILVAGSGSLKPQVLDLLKNKNQFLGEIDLEELKDFFRKIDILIISSFEESGPLVGIEAMAAGKIIFSTKVGAMVGRLSKTKNNFWFDINKKESLLDLIANLQNFSDDEIIEIKKSNRRIFLENYSMQNVSSQYVEVFDEALNKNK